MSMGGPGVSIRGVRILRPEIYHRCQTLERIHRSICREALALTGRMG